PEVLAAPPTLEHDLDVAAHAFVRVLPAQAAHQQLVAAGVFAPDGGDDRQLDCAWIKGAAGAASDAAAAARGGVKGDRLGAPVGTAGEQPGYLGREARAQLGVVAAAAFRLALAAPRSRLLV